MRKRILSTFLALCMVLTLLPTMAWATEVSETTDSIEPTDSIDAAVESDDEAVSATINFLCWPSAVGTGQPFELTVESVTADNIELDMSAAQVTEVKAVWVFSGGMFPDGSVSELPVTVNGVYDNNGSEMILSFEEGIALTGLHGLDVTFTVTVNEKVYHAEGTSVLNVVNDYLLPPADADPNLSAFSFNRIHIGEETGYIDFNLDWQKNRVVFDTTKPLGIPEEGDGYYWEIDFGETNLEIDWTKGFVPHDVKEHGGYTWIDIFLAAKDGGTAQPGTITITIRKEALIGAKMDLVHTVEVIRPCPAPDDVAYVMDDSGVPVGVTWTQTLTEEMRPAEGFFVKVESAKGTAVYLEHVDNDNIPGLLEINGELIEGTGVLTYTYYFLQEGIEDPWNPENLPPDDYSLVISAGTTVDNMIVFGPSWTKEAPPVEPEPDEPDDRPIRPSLPDRPSKPSEKPSKPEKPTEKPVEPEIPAQPETPVQPQEPVVPVPVYDDVAPDAWYSEAAAYVASKGLMTGTSEGNFSPNEQMTRAMVWTVLGRMAGADVDGSGNEWYAKAQAWAAASGVSDGANPNGGVTRQELAVMLWRSAGSPEGTAEMSAFSDGGEVAEWAGAAMRWAVANGVLNGDNGALKPGAPASRAEVAAMLMRFCEKMGL